ncbi:unnamed protein product [Arabis nemorensis]|uniref:DUF674 domain-containing protein n=1 Tax=Arabis nemorensis TaxID=586526 RepID=A0A565BD91_9BRAS|nr:unnamed protein product [Arabis nemorensis]
MAGTESSEKQIFKLKLLVDKEKKKVVLAKAGKDFVDVLFSFLLMPMETIVRLLENQKSQTRTTIGCFNNLYKGVVDVGKDYFLTEACKQILLYPRYAKKRQCRRLKLNIDDTEGLKYYRCPNLGISQSCSEAYSNFCSLRCSCGEMMAEEIKVVAGGSDEIFVSQKTSFMVTGNMEVEFASIVFTMKTLRGLGYKNLDNIEEMFVDGRKELLWIRSGSNIELGRIDDFCKSMKSLRSSGGTNALTCTHILPWKYRLRAPLLDVCCTSDFNAWLVTINSRPYDLKLMYPNYDGSSKSTTHCSNGLVRRDTTYIISDDLTITSTKLSSTFCIMKKWGVDLDDIEVQVINISKAELTASLMTSTALTTALGSLLPKKPKEEKL